MERKLIAFILVVFVSCSSDDDPTINAMFPLHGLVFNLTEVNVDTALDLNGDGVFSKNLLEEVECLKTNTLYFLSDSYARNAEPIELFLNEFGEYEYSCKSSVSVGQYALYDNGRKLFITENLSIGQPKRTTFDFDGNRLVENRGENLPNFVSFVYTKQ